VQVNERRRDLLCALVVCLFAIGNWLPRLSGPIDFRWDGGVYYTLGTSLYEGNGYRLLNEPGEIRANQYPPLLPAIIAAHEAIAGSTDPFVVGQLIRRSWMIVYVVYIAGVFWLLKRYVGPYLAAAAALITILNPQTTFLSEVCFAEVLFAAVSIGFFLLNRERGSWAFWGAYTAATACFLLRAIGIAVLAAWVLEPLWQRRPKPAFARAVLALVPVLAWQSYIHLVETSREYRQPAYTYQRADYMFYNVSYAVNVRLKDPFTPTQGYASAAGMIVRTFSDVRPLLYGLGESVSSSYYSWARQMDWTGDRIPGRVKGAIIRVGELSLAGLILLGLIRLVMVYPAMAIYVCLSMLAIAAAPWPSQYPRYLSPLAPYLALSLILGVALIGRLLWTRHPGRLSKVLISFVLVSQAISLALCYSDNHAEVVETTRGGQQVRFHLFFYMREHRLLDATQDWVLRHTRPSDVVASAMPHWAWLRTGRKAVMVPFGSDSQTLEHLLDSVPVNYALLCNIEPLGVTDGVARAVERSPGWRLAYSPGDNCRVYERIPLHSATVWIPQ
jgi:hypothetical protein